MGESAWLWIGLGLALWLLIALVVALLIGRTVRGRERQTPQGGDRPGRRDGQVPPSGSRARGRVGRRRIP
jgi:hypothetical protein